LKNKESMDVFDIIDKYYPKGRLREILLIHSRSVTDKALEICKKHPELNADVSFIEEAAMLHDIGIFMTDAVGIECRGSQPYLCHGHLGANLMREEGFPKHALVCERHTGAGISKEDIETSGLPLPKQDFIPVSIEEQIICFADKFYSKTHIDREKTVEQARKSLEKYGEAGVKRFDKWCTLFL
jgi:uncharacterized protein